MFEAGDESEVLACNELERRLQLYSETRADSVMRSECPASVEVEGNGAAKLQSRTPSKTFLQRCNRGKRAIL